MIKRFLTAMKRFVVPLMWSWVVICAISGLQGTAKKLKTGHGRRIVRREAVHVLCQSPIGVENFKITDAQMSASSVKDEESVASSGRPSLGVAWVAGIVDFRQYLQIDTGTISIISGIATYGHPSGKPRIIKYFLLYGFTENDLERYSVRKAFEGNIVSSARRYHEMIPVRLRLLRLCPVIWLGGIAASVELYGCKSECAFPLGISTTQLSHKAMTATSFASHYSRPEYGRLHGSAGLGAWCAGVQDSQQYIQIDLARVVIVSGVAVQGQKHGDNWVKKFKLSVSYDHHLHVWKWYRMGQVRVFEGNQDQDTPVFHFFKDSVMARCVRLHPVSWHGSICLRMELYGCDKWLGMDEESSWACFHDHGVDNCVCNEGFEGNFCRDTDECNMFGKAMCGPHQHCINTYGGYECKCNPGYTHWYEDECVDIDECSNSSVVCRAHSVCINTPGSYKCQCQEGFVIDPDKASGSPCVDLDECQIPGSCPHNATCTNMARGFTCECNKGFTSDDPTITCSDIDECNTPNTTECAPNATCVNTVGSYLCDCGAGYVNINKTCQDRDECAENSHDCVDHSSYCINTVGSYECTCRHGFVNNNNVCLDKNECLDEQHDCDKNAFCVNIAGSYECFCKDGYTGRGKTGQCTKMPEEEATTSTP